MAIVARQLNKALGETQAVRALDLEVAAGEVYGLIGPNGAGKTTALRMLAGLMRPDSGTASIAGFDVVRQESQAKAALGFHTGSTGLYQRLTVRELLAYFADLYGVSPSDFPGRLARVAQSLGVEHLLHRRCAQLSTGEKQKVSLARATIHHPPVLILDEPTSGLDVLASRFVADFVKAARQQGRAVLFSTHYMTEAELLCDRVGFLHQGRLLCQGTPQEIKEQLEQSTLEEAFLQLVHVHREQQESHL